VDSLATDGPSGVIPEHSPTRPHDTLQSGRLYVVSVKEAHIVVREPTDVMLVRVADELSEIQEAWAAFETAVGLRGRKFYGAFDPVANIYSVCAVLRPDDDPSVFGAEAGHAPRRPIRLRPPAR